LLELRGVACRAGAFRIGPVELSLAAGEYRCVMGATGSGKTVLLETVAGIRPAARGAILLDGGDITDEPPERRGFGFSYQDSLLFPFLNVRENILFGVTRGRRRPPRDPAVEARLLGLARLMGIDSLLSRNPRFLSGGERQRVSLARALLPAPRLALLDEPLSAVDADTALRVRELLLAVRRERKTAVIHVTHDPREAALLADSVSKIENGAFATGAA